MSIVKICAGVFVVSFAVGFAAKVVPAIRARHKRDKRDDERQVKNLRNCAREQVERSIGNAAAMKLVVDAQDLITDYVESGAEIFLDLAEADLQEIEALLKPAAAS
jgi:hypothetical protein